MRRKHRSTILVLVAFFVGGPLLFSVGCPEPTERYSTDAAVIPGDGDADGDMDGDADRDADVDEDADEDAETTSDAGDADAGDAGCVEEGTFCLDNQIHRCSSDGEGTELILDCNQPPFTECRLDLCSPGVTAPHPCCMSESPLCNARISIEGEEPLEINYSGNWDEGYACRGYIVDEGEFTFRVEAQSDVCEEGYLRIVISGRLDDLTIGESREICDGDSSPFRVDIYLSRYDADTAEWVLDSFMIGNCEPPGGTLTLTEWGTTAGSPFELSLEVTLHDSTTETTRDLSIASDGLVVLYE